jgi:hypothetical protein
LLEFSHATKLFLASRRKAKGNKMTKVEALNKAQAARHAATVKQATVALYAVTFGGNDNLTQAAMLDADVATEAAQKWEQVAAMHPATRNSMIRKQALPTFMFGY